MTTRSRTVSWIAAAGAALALAIPLAAPAAAAPPPDEDRSVLVTRDPVRILQAATLAANSTQQVTVPNLPGATQAVLVNVTATDATAVTTVRACPTGTCTPGETLSVRPGLPTSRQLVAPVEDGKITLRNISGSVQVRVDLAGYVRPSLLAGGESFLPVDHQRVLSWHLLNAGSATTHQLPGAPAGAKAAVIDIGYSAATADSYVSACRATVAPATCSQTAVIHTAPDTNHSNLVVVPVDSTGSIKLYNATGSVRLNADLQGWIVPRGSDTAAGELVAGSGSLSTRIHSAGGTREVELPNVPDGATAALVVVKTTASSAVTGLSACPTGAVTTGCQAASVANPLPGTISENIAYVTLGGPGGNKLTLGSTASNADVTVQPVGYFIPAAALPAPRVKPGPSNTGVPAGTALTVHNGDITITQNGTVIDGKDVHGFINVRAKDVVIRNSIVRGSGPGNSNRGLITCNHNNCSNLLVEDVTLVPKAPSVWLNGVFGHDYTARRVNTYNVVDGFQVHNVRNNGGPVNVVIEDSWCHDMTYFAVDPNHNNTPTHNDCIQLQGGSNIRIVGNNLESFMSTTAGDQNYNARNRGSGLMVTPNAAPVSGVVATDNWFDGGEASAFFHTSKFPELDFGVFSRNKFGRNQYNFGNNSRYQIRVAKPELTTFDVPLTTNMWEDGADFLAEGRDLGIRFGS